MTTENNEETKLESVTKEQEDALYTDKAKADSEQTDTSDKDSVEGNQDSKEDDGAAVDGDKNEDKAAEDDTNKKEEISYKLELGKETFLDNSHVESVTAFAKENNLTNDKAQELLSKQDELLSSFVTSEAEKVETEIEGWRQSVIDDKVLGGENLKKTTEDARRVVERFGGEGLVGILNDTGYGNHPAVVGFLSKLGSIMSEDSLVIPNSIEKKDIPAEDLFYGKPD